MSACDDRTGLIHAFADDELDAANSREVEVHVAECETCRAELRRIEALRRELAHAPRHVAPPSLQDRIESALAAESGAAPARAVGPTAGARARPQPVSAGRGVWFGGGAAVGLAASLVLMIGVPQLTTASIEDEVVTSHVRSLLADHVTDVAASSRHVVKPWFAGRIDYAPPVPDLADAGFQLVGGRLDYVDRRTVPAIVYRRQLHVINLFVLPSSSRAPARTVRTREDGYNIVGWDAGGLRYWAVSDVEAGELDRFQRVFLARTAFPAAGPTNRQR